MINVVKKNDNLIIYWLLLSLFLVFSMIIVGGLTRLTDSGLSITEWELFKGIIPPLTNEAWIKYFNLYKEIPQYELINSNMSLKEFKIIYFWEYGHRILGRIIGLFFLIPLIYFHYKKMINKRNIKILYFIMFLILIQGIVGWYMVQSGLVNDVTVSHYRLSLHLSLAILIISIIFWQILNFKSQKSVKFFEIKINYLPFLILIFLVFLQIILGAFVSGLDAGRIYQTWPLMGHTYFPNDIVLENIKFFFDFDNHSLIQFYHRNLAYFISLYIFILCSMIFFKKLKNLFPWAFLVLIILLFQILLGVFSLISNLNIIIASGHQITSVILILSLLNLYHKYIK